MQLLLDLSEGERKPVHVEVLAILFHAGQRLYAVIGIMDGAPWYGLVHEAQHRASAHLTLRVTPSPRHKRGSFFATDTGCQSSMTPSGSEASTRSIRN